MNGTEGGSGGGGGGNAALKADWANAAQIYELQSQQAAFDAALLASLGAEGFAAAAAGVAFLCYLAQKYYQGLAENDPPDPNYTSIATPSDPTTPTTGLSADAATAVTALSQTVGLAAVIQTTYNRMETALSAGDATAAQQQAVALAAYESQSATATTAFTNALPSLSSTLVTAIGTPPTAAQVAAFQSQLSTSGLPAVLLSEAQALGLDSATQQDFASGIVAQDPTQIASQAPSGLITPTTDSTFGSLATDLIASSAPCFAAGTRIAIEHGEAAVEHLRVGDRARLADGALAPIAWLGRRRVTCRRHPRPSDVHPVRVAAHAFGVGRPTRDVLLSPDHAVFMEGVLIPVRYLLNDATVRQEQVDAVTYWHVELRAHGVLLADGLPAESYLDTGNRGAFANGGAVVMAEADFARGVWQRDACAPLVTEGPKRDLVHRRLLAQALALGWKLTNAGDGASHWLSPHPSQDASSSMPPRSSAFGA